jgi:hypothetical protein
VLEDLDAGFFLHALARRDRLVVMADLSYVDTSRKGGFDSLPAAAGRASVTQLSATLAGGWRVLAGEGLDLDILAGLRGWSIDSTAEIRVAGAPFAGASSTLAWVDPVLAFRLRADLAPALSALVVADVGGLGLGSRGTFQLAATLNLAVAEGVFVSAGYRHLAVDYREGGQRLDLALSGPLLGLTWRF